METISGDVWQNQTVKDAMRRAKKRVFCIAYITKLPRGMFKKGDVVICDAGKHAVSSGECDPHLLLKLLSNGVEVYSCNALHAKCAVFDDNVLIGSANLSASSAERLYELAVIQKDLALAVQVRQFVNELIEDGRAVCLDKKTVCGLKSLWRPGRTPWQGRLPSREKEPLSVLKRSHEGVFYFVESLVPIARDPADLSEEKDAQNTTEAKARAKALGVLNGHEIYWFKPWRKNGEELYKVGDRIVIVDYNTREENSLAKVYGSGVIVKVAKEQKHCYIYYARSKKSAPYGKFKSDKDVIAAVGRLRKRVSRRISKDKFDALEKVLKRLSK